MRGAGWVLLFSGAGKVVTLGSQLVLAWLLLPEAFGLAAVALSAGSVVAVLGASNFITLLVQRDGRFEEDAGQVFWLSLASAGLAALVLVASAPVLARAVGEPAVAPLVGLVALALPFQALATVYAADLLHRLQFRTLTVIHFGMLVVQHGLTVLLALWWANAFALVVPLVIAAAVGAAWQAWAADRVPITRPRPGVWRPLIAPAGWLFAITAGTAAIQHGPALVIKLFRSADVVGFYYWGYMLAGQAVFLLVNKLRDVLFPALTKLNAAPDRQRAAFGEALEALLLVTVPVCVLQALLVGPLIEVVFGARWVPAVAVVQALSLALAWQPLVGLGSAVLTAQGAFARLAALTAVMGALVLGGAALGAALGEQSVVAAAVGGGLTVAALGYGVAGARAVGGGLALLAPGLGRALLLGGVALAAGAGALQATASLGVVAQVALVTLASLGAYGGLAALVAPRALRRLGARVRRAVSPPVPEDA